MAEADGAPPVALDVDAIVLAAGRGERLGLGPKALLRLGGRSLLDRAIAALQPLARRVIVGVPEDLAEGWVGRTDRPLAGSVIVLAGGATRMDTTLRLLRACTAPFIVQHDVVHPFVTEELTRRVLAAARRTGAALAAVRSEAHVYRGDTRVAERVPGAGGLWLAQKPLAYSREALTRALGSGAALPDGAGALGLMLAAGQAIEIVPGEPWNVKISTPSDWALAQVLDQALAAGALGRADAAPQGAGLR
jgi:2-C-methyl-D-erythritol 4-phosphate cytidylyltransferase